MNEEIEKSLAGQYLKFDETGKIGPLRVTELKRVEAPDPKYADTEGKRYEIWFEEDGDEMVLTTTSKRLIKELIGVEVGDVIEITRVGEGFSTQYSVRKVLQQ